MPNYAIIENGVVVNAVIAEPEYATKQGWIGLPAGAGIGWDYDGANFTDNRPVPEIIIPPAPTKEQLMAELAALTAKINAL
jgi:hypothetical protein